MKVKSDIEIAREATKLPIKEVAKKLGIEEEELIPFGHDKAKVSDQFIRSVKNNQNGKLILVTAVNPTPAGTRLSRYPSYIGTMISWILRIVVRVASSLATRRTAAKPDSVKAARIETMTSETNNSTSVKPVLVVS